MAEISQRLVTCPNGHLYDANKHASCPFCQGAGGFSRTVDVNGAGAGGFSRTVDVNAPGVGGQFAPTVDPIAVTPAVNASASNFSVTAPPQVPQNPSGMKKTIFVDDSTPSGSLSPVVGWLVAIDGPNRGADYRIHVGYNYIGRERGDIRIGGDMSISAEKDSNITFVSQTNKFYIAHEQGKNVLLVNDLPAIGNGIELHNYDRITIGNTKLLFVGLCGEAFSWSEKRENQNV